MTRIQNGENFFPLIASTIEKQNKQKQTLQQRGTEIEKNKVTVKASWTDAQKRVLRKKVKQKDK